MVYSGVGGRLHIFDLGILQASDISSIYVIYISSIHEFCGTAIYG